MSTKWNTGSHCLCGRLRAECRVIRRHPLLQFVVGDMDVFRFADGTTRCRVKECNWKTEGTVTILALWRTNFYMADSSRTNLGYKTDFICCSSRQRSRVRECGAPVGAFMYVAGLVEGPCADGLIWWIAYFISWLPGLARVSTPL